MAIAAAAAVLACCCYCINCCSKETSSQFRIERGFVKLPFENQNVNCHTKKCNY